jgi:hypothetical protein
VPGRLLGLSGRLLLLLLKPRLSLLKPRGVLGRVSGLLGLRRLALLSPAVAHDGWHANDLEVNVHSTALTLSARHFKAHRDWPSALNATERLLELAGSIVKALEL